MIFSAKRRLLARRGCIHYSPIWVSLPNPVEASSLRFEIPPFDSAKASTPFRVAAPQRPNDVFVREQVLFIPDERVSNGISIGLIGDEGVQRVATEVVGIFVGLESLAG